MDLAEPLALVPGLLIQGVGRAARFDDAGVMPWIVRLRHEKEIVFADPQQDIMLGKILAESRLGASELVETLRLEEIHAAPRPCLTLRTPRQNWGPNSDRLLGELEFDYGGALLPAGRTTPLAVSTELNLVIRRDPAAEASADVLLFEMGFREAKDHRVEPGTMELPPKRMAQVTRDLVGLGWRVEAEGKLIRPAGEFKLAVTTGIDWFELGGGVDFGGQGLSLPDLLAAARRGETMVTLGDGSMGMLPEDWLKKYGMLADLGTAEDGCLRFGNEQAGLLDALLAAQPEIAATRRSRRSASGSTTSRGSSRSTRRRASTGSSAPISARASAGSTTSRSSTSAASSPTTWAWARRSRCWRSCRAAARGGRPRGPRWASSPARSSSTGSRRPSGSPPA